MGGSETMIELLCEENYYAINSYACECRACNAMPDRAALRTWTVAESFETEQHF